jgi:hypothetical protein
VDLAKVWNQLEVETVRLRRDGNLTVDRIEHCTAEERLATYRNEFAQQESLMQKEIRRCQKSEKALGIMYKMYN